MMSQEAAQPKRDWREIAAEVEKEADPRRLLELSKELERALAEREKKLKLARQPNSTGVVHQP
jgi:hypothetical protein